MSGLCGVALEHPIMNAAGTCKTREDVDAFARSAVSAIVLGSITLEPRSGNSGNVYWSTRTYSMNALGLPNRGLDYYARHLPGMVDAAHRAGKPLIVSVAGFSTAEYRDIATAVARTGVDLIELNLACPNVWDGGEQKRIACFDPGQTAAICTAVGDALLAGSGTAAAPEAEAGAGAGAGAGVEAGAGVAAGAGREGVTRFGVKISPFSDPAGLAELAGVIGDLAGRPGGPRFVTAVNTFPNAYLVDEANRPVIDVELAGLAGPALKPVGLGQVRQLRRLLPDIVELVGVGGITDGRDVVDYQRAGAVAVQAATTFWNRAEDPTVFGTILSDWIDHTDPAVD